MNRVNSSNLDVNNESGVSSATIIKEGDNDNSYKLIRQQLDDDWKILSAIPDLLISENAFCTKEGDWSKEKIVDFVQPEQLKVIKSTT